MTENQHKNSPFYRHNHHLNKHPLHSRLLFYLIVLVFLVVISTWLGSGFKSILPSDFLNVFSRITLQRVLLLSAFTLVRLLTSYIIAVLFTFFVLLVIVPHKLLESFLLPIFDILQSVPVLAFFPLIIIVFARLHLPEIAAQIVLITAMLWSILFGALGGLTQIPEDITDAARIYGAKGFQKFRHVTLPAIFPNLVTGSILSFGAGWNVIIISEYINYGSIQIRLPGLGNLISSSAGNDNGVFILAIIVLVIIIAVANRLIWRRLLNYAEKFRFE